VQLRKSRVSNFIPEPVGGMFLEKRQSYVFFSPTCEGGRDRC